MSDRTTLGRRATIAGLLASTGALAAEPGRPVFLDFGQAALDDAYNQGAWAPDAATTIAGYVTASAAVRARMPPQTERYGPGAAEVLDVFAPTGATGAPVLMFLHGGAWRSLTKDDASAAAPTFTGAGCIYVAPNFDNIPATTLPGMADQLRRAVLWVAANATRFGGDPARLFVAGHSSGAHLAAVLLTTDWAALGAPAGVLKGGACLSGIYELHPALLSARSSYVHLSTTEIAALSPLRWMSRIPGPVIVANGDRESPEFKRQADTFAQVLAGMGCLRARAVLPAIDHFRVPNELNDPSTALSRAVLGMMIGAVP